MAVSRNNLCIHECPWYEILLLTCPVFYSSGTTTTRTSTASFFRVLSTPKVLFPCFWVVLTAYITFSLWLGRFLSVDAGYYGRLGDSGCLRNSPIWDSDVHDELFHNRGYYLYGDSAYPLKRWLLKGFPAISATSEERKFNTQGSRARVIAECAYGKLKVSDYLYMKILNWLTKRFIVKAQWRTLHVGLRTHNHDFWVRTVHACCILHNITIDQCDQGWSLKDDFSHQLIVNSVLTYVFGENAHVPTTAPPPLPDDDDAKAWWQSLLEYLQQTPDW